MKRYLAVYAVVTLLTALRIGLYFSKNLDSGENGTKQVAVLFPGGVKFFADQRKYMEFEAAKRGIELTVFDAGWSTRKQVEQFDLAVNSGVQAIALCAADNKISGILTDRVTGVKLITFTNSLGNDRLGRFPGVLAHVGRDEVKSGLLLAEQVRALEIPNPRIVFIQGSEGTTPQLFREAGFLAIAKRNPDWDIVADIKVFEWNSNEAAKQVEMLIESDIGFDVVCSQWADAAVSIANVLKQRRIPNVKQCTLECNETLEMVMMDGGVESTTVFELRDEATRVIDVLENCLDGKPIPRWLEVTQNILYRKEVEMAMASRQDISK